MVYDPLRAKSDIIQVDDRVTWKSRAVVYTGKVEYIRDRVMYAHVRVDNGKLYRVRKYRLTKLAPAADEQETHIE